MTGRPITVRAVVPPAPHREVMRRLLPHGEDPARILRLGGWTPDEPLSVTGRLGAEGGVTITFLVHTPNPSPSPPGAPACAAMLRDPGFTLRPDERLTVRQRLAVYAVVRSERGILLTQYSDKTNAPGRWGLPGGGVDDDEEVGDALAREVWEETGQIIDLHGLRLVTTTRWIGRGPSGIAEDFHAVRVIFEATCPTPTTPVVHDHDGTTLDAEWVPARALGETALTTAATDILTRVGLRPEGSS